MGAACSGAQCRLTPWRAPHEHAHEGGNDCDAHLVMSENRIAWRGQGHGDALTSVCIPIGFEA